MCSLSLHSQSRTAPINTTTRLRIHCACQSQSKPFHHFVDDLETFRMAIGPLARILAQVIVPVVAVLARALPAAYAQALQNAKKQGVNPAQATSMLRKTITQQEAFQILNLSESEASAEAIQKQYDKYMAANDVSKGGSFYLQSKVYRAKELLQEFEKGARTEMKKESNQSDSSNQ